MSDTNTPRTDANKHAHAHIERYGFENSLDDRKVEWPILCEEIERELAEARETLESLTTTALDLLASLGRAREETDEAQAQRDRLAEAAHYMRHAMKDDPCMWNYAIDFYESTINQIKQNNE
jgi:hypothetical protein